MLSFWSTVPAGSKCFLIGQQYLQFPSWQQYQQVQNSSFSKQYQQARQGFLFGNSTSKFETLSFMATVPAGLT